MLLLNSSLGIINQSIWRCRNEHLCWNSNPAEVFGSFAISFMRGVKSLVRDLLTVGEHQVQQEFLEEAAVAWSTMIQEERTSISVKGSLDKV